MSDVQARSQGTTTIELIVTRADGTIEDLGVVSYWHRNPLKRLAWRVKQFIQGKIIKCHNRFNRLVLLQSRQISSPLL